MKITPLSESHATSSLPTSKVEAAGSGKTPATSKSWVVSLSSAVQSMAHVDTLAGVMNMAKVDSVRAEFQKGTFRVNPEASLKQAIDFLAEVNRSVGESACALRKAEPLLLLKSSEALSQMMTKWHRSELDGQGTAPLKDKLSHLEIVIEQLKLQQSHLQQQKAQVEKQLKVLLPDWSNGLYANSS
eukprot:gene30445-37662_t